MKKITEQKMRDIQLAIDNFMASSHEWPLEDCVAFVRSALMGIGVRRVTSTKWASIREQHRSQITAAIDKGAVIPLDVLRGYPDLRAKYVRKQKNI